MIHCLIHCHQSQQRCRRCTQTLRLPATPQLQLQVEHPQVMSSSGLYTNTLFLSLYLSLSLDVFLIISLIVKHRNMPKYMTDCDNVLLRRYYLVE